MKQEITYEEFLDIENKLEIKSGMIIDISDVPKSNKLIQLKVEFDAENDIRTVVTNIKPRLLSKYGEDWQKFLKFNNFLFVTNLKASIIMGVESKAMILPGEIEKELIKVNHKNNILL